MKRIKSEKPPFLVRETLREKWRRELLSRRVDGRSMEPIRLRVRALCERRRVRRQQPF